MQRHVIRFLRSVFGLFAGSAGALITYLAIVRLLGRYTHLDVDPTLELAGPGFVTIFMLSLPFGFAGHAALCALKWRRLWAYCAVAGLEAGAFCLISNVRDLTSMDLKEMAAEIPSAAVCAAIAWLIRRPDRDARLLSEKP